MKQIYLFLFLCSLPALPLRADSASLHSVRRIYLENLDPTFQQYLKLEFTRQFHGQVNVVLDRRLADAILTGHTEKQPGAALRAGRPLGLNNVSVGTVDLLDHEGKVVLWTERAGDRGTLIGEPGTERVASRLVKKLKKAMR